MERPNIRFDGESLSEISEKWAHAQNDALGYSLWMVFRLCNLKKYKLTNKDWRIWTLFPLYFQAIEFWHDEDSGHWEEDRAIKSSSVGVVIAGLNEMRLYLKNNRNTKFHHRGRCVDEKLLDRLIKKGLNRLKKSLPQETPGVREADSALLFLIYPLAIVDSRQATKILSLIESTLVGKVGIKRYVGDSYWCADYKKLLKTSKQAIDYSDDIDLRNKLLRPGQEAQWCIFDAIISVIYGQKYLATGKKKYYMMQIKYFNRSLNQLTKHEFKGGAGQCPEVYYINSSIDGKYLPNDNTPLAWSQASLAVAFEYLKKTVLLE